MINVLFLCTGNSARSIMAEMYLNHAGRGRFRAFSAGSYPKGAVHPLSLDTLRTADIPVTDARSKSWDEFAAPGGPRMDLVITVCDNAAGEVCPIWPGTPSKAHWSFPDPAAAEGTDAQKRAAFAHIFADIRATIDRLVALPAETLSAGDLARRIAAIGPA
jgi:arsenate reductase (thioredoxin)